MKKQILFIVMLMCSLSALAVKLPSDPYRSYEGSVANTATYTIGSGTTFVNSSIVGSYEGICVVDKQNPSAIEDCEACCLREAYIPCIQQGGTEETCGPLNKECFNACMGVSLPLDAPTAFLLALVAAYGAVAVYRTKVTKTM